MRAPRLLGRAAALAALALLAIAPPAFAAEVGARLERSRIVAGEATTLEVTVRGAPIGVETPEFTPPDGIQLLGTGRARNFTLVDGRSAVETIFRFEISAASPGSYGLGPIAVNVGREIFRSGVLTLEVIAAPSRLAAPDAAAPAGSAASLLVDVTPAEPWVGQSCVLRVRFVQRAPLAEDPQYTPPATPGFWTDGTSAPESYSADEGGRRVLVTETRTRLYPLAAGTATVGEAVASLVLAAGRSDPLSWMGGQAPRREIVVRSRPVAVRVRALPAGAPAGFSGAVGDFAVRWTADRPRTSVDVPVTVRLDVRGRGNLPLLRPPELAGGEVEVFASTMDDSMPARGADAAGRRRFQWTVLARRIGRMTLAAPAFSWFDPGRGSYRLAELPALGIDVSAPLFAGGEGAELPPAFARHPIDPGARGPSPWGWSLAGCLIGIAVAAWRGGADPRRAAAERAQPLEWLRAVGRTSGPDFWRAADEASAWLAARGRGDDGLRREIVAARYGGTGHDVESIRRRLVEAISTALPPRANRGPRRAATVALGLLAVVLAAWSGPRAGDARLAGRVRAADQRARTGDVPGAHAEWARVWSEEAHAPGLAARLAWAELRAGAIGPSAAWVVRGELAGTRDPALGWVRDRVREGGGLVGDQPVRWPVRPLEWAIAGLVAGVAAGVLWPRRRWAGACLLLSLLAGVADATQIAISDPSARAIVQQSVTLEGTGIDLLPGQVVRRLGSRDGRERVDAGGGVSGWVPAAAIEPVSGAATEGVEP